MKQKLQKLKEDRNNFAEYIIRLNEENFLNEEELSFWRNSVTEAIQQRNGRKFATSDAKVGEDDGINIKIFRLHFY